MKYKKYFSSSLLQWDNTENVRQMPWKCEKDPYKIWISEIILQQTRVQQGINYYIRFITEFPDVKSLATAPQKKVYKLWEGLGYYSRCKNLIETAKFIYKNLDGKFPEKYEDILSLKGIGNYTASAIASFAYNKPYAVLDGNVFRVLSRFFGIEIPINTTEGKKMYRQLSQQLIDKQRPAEYNQAIMDFGAVICKPLLPLCKECPLRKKCLAYFDNKTELLPINNKTVKQKQRFFNYLIVEYKSKFYVNKRTQKDIWENLYEFILIETKSWKKEKEIFIDASFLALIQDNIYMLKSESKRIMQKLTHQHIVGHFFHIEIGKPLKKSEKYYLVPKKEIKLLPFPKIIASYFADKNVSLNLL
ncbi:MAG TPA: A/G-specific adenine glycosylase [Hanamia sp.]|nr:A/G-specific adenine glycosylase [Hanamia sp.]